MKAREALIAWTPSHYADDRYDERYASSRWLETIGQVKVGYLLSDKDEYDWTYPYAYTGGAAYIKTRNLRGDKAVAMVFIDFHSMVVRDGIDPKVAHEAFLVIDEYRKHISGDIKGADNT